MANIFYLLSGPWKSVVALYIKCRFSWQKLTSHVFGKTSQRQAGNLTSTLLNSVSGSKRGKKGTFLHLYQDHPEKYIKRINSILNGGSN